MIKNYLLITFRNIFRNKLFSGVNILGLAFGICSTLLILLWVFDELQVDKFHAQSDRLYRVMENQKASDGRIYTWAATPGPMAPFIKDKYPEIELATRVTWGENLLFQFGEKSFYNEGIYVDPDFLQMFTFPLLVGDVNTALKDKSSVVISRKMAESYFGSAQAALGKILQVDTKKTYTVTGVLEEIPKSASMQFEYLLPFQVFFDVNKEWLDEWDNNNVRTYLVLTRGTDVTSFSNKFRDEIATHEAKTNVSLFVQPYGDAYLYGDFDNGVQSGGRIETVNIFLIVAAFVLLIACINFMNLSTAQATKRAKEVGLRKVIGAVPHQLFRQFMAESFFTVVLSAAIAVLLTFMLLPGFNILTGKDVQLHAVDPIVWFIFAGIIVFTGFAAGSYPALIIAGFKPAQVLKGQLKSGNRAATFRKSLVVVQFSLSIILIISTIVVFRQMSFMEDRDIGFDRQNLYSIWMEGGLSKKYESFRNQLLAMPGIESVTASSQSPISVGNSTYGVQWEGKDPEDKILFSNMNVDYDFVQSLKMEMAEGRAFDRSQVVDSDNYVLNEAAAAKIGLNDIVGREITMWDQKGKVIGVVKNFNFGSLHSAVEPLIMRIDTAWMNCMLIRSEAGKTAEALQSTEKLWKEYLPQYPLRYKFLSHDWEEYYKSESQRGKVFNVLSIVSIFISCLGLFGLSAFSAERRTKELGIRKAMGASTSGLVRLMGQEFSVLVAVAAVIGCPVGWYFMNKWLESYAYHVEVGYLVPFIAALACFVVSVLTVAYHSLRAATKDPVQTLRHE
ncbi:ABC transporter permease [Fulvivirgaceae bacterium PWU5]|uniref:ABC transporter permease n=1 Tax=Dawidia cretensis TaxID=2782350 RepID=A0AAP2DX49_9BACT|nr:ABC transporter permease [Dawidia cretensis]MBT1709235.1 ABC transporter permease [Dawidia cretensis]